MPTWGPDARQAAFPFTYDNLGEPGEIEQGLWPANKPFGAHASVHETLPVILGVMRRQGHKVTFFIEGWTADHYPDAVRRIHDEGHEVACHAYCHETWFKLSDSDQTALLTRATEAFGRIGIRPLGFRMPGGASSDFTETLAASLGYRYVSPAGGLAGTRNGLAIMPYQMGAVDLCYYLSAVAGQYAHARITPGGSETDRIVEGFRLTRDDTVAAGDCSASISHVTIPLTGAERPVALEAMIRELRADDRVWSPTLGEAADWILANANDYPKPALRKLGDDWDPNKLNKTYVKEARAS